MVYPVDWHGAREAAVLAGDLLAKGRYLMRRNLLGKWRVVERPLFE